jgi:hypothetical protein
MSSTDGMTPPENLTRSKQRVADHGEVFTPAWLVEDMLDLVRNESERIESRFLESACGAGNFLKQVLGRKLAVVKHRYSASNFETRHYALLALMSIYGIELLQDNAEQCRQDLVTQYANFLSVGHDDVWYLAAKKVVDVNIIQGDALTLLTADGEKISFPEWSYLGKGMFQRRDFHFLALTQRASIKGTLFELFKDEENFVPVTTFPLMTTEEISR